VDRYSNGLELQVLLPVKRLRKQQQQQEAQALGGAALSKLVAKEKRALVQVELPNGAYTTRQDFIGMLQAQLTAATAKQQLPGRFEARLEDGDVVLSSTKCPFRILFKVWHVQVMSEVSQVRVQNNRCRRR
jgi:hypothetical protein